MTGQGRITLFAALAVLVGALPLSSASAAGGAGYRIVWDDFRDGFTVDTPDAKWLHFSQGTYVADDGVVTTSPFGLQVDSRGTNPFTGKPVFTNTMGHDAGPLSAFDHVKWLVVMNHFASSGLPGFDAVDGRVLSCQASISGQIHGLQDHPFGPAVGSPDTDPRLGAVAISAFDPDTLVIFNFLLTNRMVFAFYERAPFARPAYGNYASFAYAVPVRARVPLQRHDLKISFDRRAGKVRWYVDGDEVFQVDRIGHRIDRRFMLLDRGGEEARVSPNQLDCGMGTFTFLDGYGRTNRGLVQVDPDAGTYFHPRLGEPMPMTFIDPASREEHRLFGQGATLRVKRFIVSSLPAHR